MSSSASGYAWFVVLIVGLFFESTRAVSETILGVLALIIVACISWAWFTDKRESEKHNGLLNSIRKKTDRIVEKHIKTLANRRDTLVRVDRYGVVDGKDWITEVQHFVDNVIRPTMTEDEAAEVHKYGMNRFFQEAIEERVARYCENRQAPASVPEGFSPSDFEGACAAVLRSHGWTASTTKGSGDQGADVIAEKDGRKLVLQCKLYTGVVGNKSIQEAIAARIFYHADLAAVVCKTSYTKSANQLAQASGVATLNFGELPDFISSLNNAPQIATGVCYTNRETAQVPLPRPNLSHGFTKGYAECREARENGDTDLEISDVAVEISRSPALAQQFKAVHFRLDAAPGMIAAPSSPDRPAEAP